MATADVLKPDFASQRKHFIFTDEHEQLRESIRRFVIKELQPHAEEWEETTFPDWVFERMGELGLPRASTSPRRTAARAATTTRAWCWPRRSSTRTAAGWRWGSPSRPTWRCRRSWPSAPRSRSRSGRRPRSPGKKILCLGITEPDAGSDVAGIKTRAVSDGDEYVINGSKTYITNGHRAHVIVLVTKTDRPTRRLTTASRCSSCRWTCPA